LLWEDEGRKGARVEGDRARGKVAREKIRTLYGRQLRLEHLSGGKVVNNGSRRMEAIVMAFLSCPNCLTGADKRAITLLTSLISNDKGKRERLGLAAEQAQK